MKSTNTKFGRWGRGGEEEEERDRNGGKGSHESLRARPTIKN